MRETWLNQRMLEELDDDHLERYTIHLEEQLGKHAVFLSQVRAEWDRRYPPQEQ